MRLSVSLLAVLAIGFLNCILARTTSVLKSRDGRSPFKKFDKVFAFSNKRTKRQAAMQCYSDLEASDDFQQFSSPADGVEEVYENNIRCTWKIHAPVNKVVVLRFPKFSVEGIADCEFDSVQVNDTSGQLSETFCGTGPNCTGKFPAKEIVTVDNVMTIYFSTDFGISYPGFTAEYRYADPPYEAQNFTTSEFTSSCALPGSTTPETNLTTTGLVSPLITNCSMLLVTGSGIKRFVLDYTNNMRCSWNITTPNEFQRVAVRFTYFSVEGISSCIYDYTTVNDSLGELSGRLCGQGVNCTGNFPNQVYVSRRRNITIGFVSDPSVTLGGFILEYYGVDPLYIPENFVTFENSSSCNRTEARAGNGSVTNNETFQANCSSNITATQNFHAFTLTTQQFYHNNARCLFNITAPARKVIVLRFTRFDVEVGNNCMYDKVAVMNSTGDTSVYCGSTSGCPGSFPTKELVSSGNNMTIFFFSDSSVIGAGFDAQVKFVEPGYIGQDFVPEVNPNTNASSCHNETVNPIPPAQNWPCWINLTASSNTQQFRTPEISPFNRHYPDSAQCMWNITAPSGFVKLSFQSFDIEGASGCSYDRVTVLDRLGPLTAPLCGQGFGCVGNFPEMEIVSRGPNMVVKMESDGSFNCGGFTATYTIEGADYNPRNISREIVGNQSITCGGTSQNVTSRRNNDCIQNLTATETPQTLVSHDTDDNQNYHDNMHCMWNITCPSDKKALIRFIYFDLEGDRTCSYDSVTLSSGDGKDQRLCGNGLQCMGNFPKQEYVSNANWLTASFRTDGSLNFSGFEAEYLCVDQSYIAQGYVADENTTFTNVECNACPDYRLRLPLGTRFGIPRGPAADVYGSNLNCQWELNTNSSEMGNLTILHYDIVPSDNCTTDAIIIWGQDIEKIRICGRSSQSHSFVFSGSLSIDFKTNSDITRTGFEAMFNAVPSLQPRKRRSLPKLFLRRHGPPLGKK